MLFFKKEQKKIKLLKIHQKENRKAFMFINIT